MELDGIVHQFVDCEINKDEEHFSGYEYTTVFVYLVIP